MATEDDARRIALSMPATTEKPSYGTPGFRVKDRLFARVHDLPDTLVVWVTDMAEKEALLASAPDRFFETPHYDGYPMVLVHLDAIELDELTEVIADSWRARAPRRLLADFDRDFAMTSAVVVGAGIAGATVALGLAQRGVVVTTVDAELEGRATAAGAGIVQPWSSAVSGPYYELYARGAAHYSTFVTRLGDLGITDIGYRRCGSLVVADDAAAIDAVEARLRERRPTAPAMGDVERLDSRETRARFAPLRAGLHSVSVSGGARVDGRLLVAGVLDATRRLGGTIRAGTVSVQPTPSGRVEVTLDGAVLGGDVVVVAGGAWTRPLLAPLGAAVDVEPQRGQIVHLHLADVDTGAWPTIFAVGDHYLVPFDGGRVVAGATRETGSGFDARVTAGGLRQVLDAALALAPGLIDATLVEVRVGLRPLAAGMVPTVGPVPGLDDVYVASGYGAAGLTMAPVLGDALAELIVTGRSPFELPAGGLAGAPIGSHDAPGESAAAEAPVSQGP